MAKRKSTKILKNDFEYDEGEVFGFTSEVPVGSNCISTFSFDDEDTITENIQNNTINSIEIKTPPSSAKETFDNRRTLLPNGAAPAIDGETPTIKRSYTFRISTIRKINELKSIHPDINVCVSTIVDIAIDYYHNHVVNEGGNQ